MAILIIVMSVIREFVLGLPGLQGASSQVLAAVEMLINDFNAKLQKEESVSEEDNLAFQKQFQLLFKSLKTPARISVLRDPNHRALIVAFIIKHGIEHYKFSYYNRAKLTKSHIGRLEEIGPIIFSEAVMIACKINLINKNSSRFYIEDHLYTQRESPVDMKIQQILKLCDEKKRTVNNNFKKLELMLQGDDYVQVVKELGKMLRDSWIKDKKKDKCTDVVKQPHGHRKQEEQQAVDQEQLDSSSSVSGEDKKEREDEIDRFSFTSSQKQLIQQEKQYAKKPIIRDLLLFDYEQSQFAVKSDFSKLNFSQEYI